MFVFVSTRLDEFVKRLIFTTKYTKSTKGKRREIHNMNFFYLNALRHSASAGDNIFGF